jgi:rhamnose utilization protein RhaD (predicted bifunctional aldolase and dehydrogenase)
MGNTTITQLLELSRELGQEERQLAILGEGNTSVRLEEGTFAIKASGYNLGSLTAAGVATCRSQDVLALFDREDVSDEEIEATLFASRLDPEGPKPSSEALFHAYLLSLPEVNFVGHTHPVSVNSILCSSRAADFAAARLFPDAIVCCGAASVLLPYVTPGVPLARAIRAGVQEFQKTLGTLPRLILMENHGIIALGSTSQAVLATTLMADKCARIYQGAVALGGPTYMSAEQIEFIAGWNVELYRQKILRM